MHAANINDVLHPNSPIQSKQSNPILNAFPYHPTSQVGLRPVHGKFEIRDVGNLGTVVHEASRSFVNPSLFSPHLCHAAVFMFPPVLQISGKTVRLDKGHNCKRASSHRHNSHPGRPVLPTLPYDSPVRDTEVPQQPVLSVDFLPRYRTTEGTCNNLENPNWAMAMNGHHRYATPFQISYNKCCLTWDISDSIVNEGSYYV